MYLYMDEYIKDPKFHIYTCQLSPENEASTNYTLRAHATNRTMLIKVDGICGESIFVLSGNNMLSR